MRPGAQPLLWNWVLFAREWKIISISKAEHLTSFWYRGPGELRNGLLWYISYSYPISSQGWIMTCILNNKIVLWVYKSRGNISYPYYRRRDVIVGTSSHGLGFFACFPGVTYQYGGYHHYPVDQYRRVDYVDSYDGESLYAFESLVYVLLFASLSYLSFPSMSASNYLIFFCLILQRRRVKSRQSDIVLGKKKCRLTDIFRKREIMGQLWKSWRSF